MPKSQLMRRVLADRRITVTRDARREVRTGQVDRRVLATLEFLAESGLVPVVRSLPSGRAADITLADPQRGVRRLRHLQAAITAMTLAAHPDHVHVGFRESFGVAGSELHARQWSALLDRLSALQQPSVPTGPSRFAIR
jgi:hypothetical protein